MPFWFFIWDGENDQHIAEHGVTPEEFEEVCRKPDYVDRSDSSGRPAAFGYTSAGRYLACFYDIIDDVTLYPVTAYTPEK